MAHAGPSSLREHGIASDGPRAWHGVNAPPAIHLYIPSRLLRGVPRVSLALIGWAVTGGPGELVIVLACALPLTRALKAGLAPLTGTVEGSAEGLEPRLLGVCASPEADGAAMGKGRAEDELDGDSVCIWLKASAVLKRAGKLRRGNASLQLDSIKHPSSVLTSPTITTTYYTPPQPRALQFLSLEPLALLRPTSARLAVDAATSAAAGQPTYSHLSPAQAKLQRKLEALTALDPDRARETRGRFKPGQGPGAGLRKAVALMNRSQLCADRFRRPSSSPSRGLAGRTYDAGGAALGQAVKGLTALTKLGSQVLQLPIPIPGFQARSARSVSTAARQLELRLSQVTLWPVLGRRLRVLRRQELKPVSALSAHYIGLWNGVWLVANDLILGSAVGLAVCEHHEAIGQALAVASRRVLIDGVVEMLDWLANWPGGVKLNTELSLFFGDLFSGLTDLWATSIFAQLEQHLPLLVLAIGLSGRFLGLTMLLSLSADLLSLLTVHLSVFYAIARTIYTSFLYLLGALFLLFRGKKRNTLRGNRIDDATYEVDQLLLGTILFTLLAFLFPTVFVYYLSFATARFGIVAARIALDTVLALLNHLPLFALMLRLKDPSRLPAGVRLVWLDTGARGPLVTSAFELHNVPLGIASIFAGYAAHLSGLVALPKLCLCVLSGAYISPLSGPNYATSQLTAEQL